MRILFLVAYPATARVRPRELIRSLARRGHQVTIATLWETEADRAALEQLREQGVRVIAAGHSRARALWNSLCALPTRTPLQAVYSWQPALARAVRSAFQQGGFDVVHVEHLRAARYGLFLQRPTSNSRLSTCNFQPSTFNLQPPIVWDSVDCISHLFAQSSRYGKGLFARVITRLELPRTRRYEGWLVGQFDRVLVTSPVDKDALERLAVRRANVPTCNRVTVLPNGVDLDYFTPHQGEREPETLVYVGKMSYHANVAAVTWFCHNILPRIWADRPDVRLFIVGMDPGRAVLALGKDPRITVTGTVPDIRPYLARATVSIAPIVYGAGTQFKILESLAMEAAVVTTSTAATPLGVQADVHLLVADTAQDFARAVLRLLDDPDFCSRIGQAGRRYVEEHHNWDTIAGRLNDVYRQAIAEKAGNIGPEG